MKRIAIGIPIKTVTHWSVIFPAEPLVETLDPTCLEKLTQCAELFGALKVGKIYDPEESCFYFPIWLQDSKLVLIKDGYAFGPGAALSTLEASVNSLWKSARDFRGCQMARPKLPTDEGAWGPLTDDKRERLNFFGTVPTDWPVPANGVGGSQTASPEGKKE